MMVVLVDGDYRSDALELDLFLEINRDGIDEAEAGEIRAALARGEEYRGGGGALAEWRLIPDKGD